MWYTQNLIMHFFLSHSLPCWHNLNLIFVTKKMSFQIIYGENWASKRERAMDVIRQHENFRQFLLEFAVCACHNGWWREREKERMNSRIICLILNDFSVTKWSSTTSSLKLTIWVSEYLQLWKPQQRAGTQVHCSIRSENAKNLKI
jgi:hypothetical protein